MISVHKNASVIIKIFDPGIGLSCDKLQAIVCSDYTATFTTHGSFFYSTYIRDRDIHETYWEVVVILRQMTHEIIIA